MGIWWNDDMSAVEVPRLQCLFGARKDVIDTPSRRELPTLVTIGVDNRSQQEARDVANYFGVSVSDRPSPDKTDSFWGRTR